MKSTGSLGVNVVGYLHAESGTGEVARAVIASLEAARIPYTPIVNRITTSRQLDVANYGQARDLHGVNLICANADQLPVIAPRVASLLSGRYTIGVWAWEVEVFPASMAASARFVDEVWTLSHFAADAISQTVDKPVHVFPLPILQRSGRTEIRQGEPKPFVFLFCFDYLSVFERKNALGLVAAYCQAFPEPDDNKARLVIKSINGDAKLEKQTQLLAAIGDRYDIALVEAYFTPDRQRELIASCDAYVSLHRSEGYGLTMAEAMSYAKPVVATGYSGNLEFMNHSNSWLVPFELVAIPRGCEPYPTEARWGEPNIEAAAEAMREVYGRSRDAVARAERGKATIRDQHSPSSREPFLRERLEVAVGAAPRAQAARRPAGWRQLRERLLPAALTDVRDLERRLDPTNRASPAALAARIYAHSTARVGRYFRPDVEGGQERLESLEARLARLDDEIHATPYISDPRALLIKGRDGQTVLGYDDASTPSPVRQDYASFEDLFRGSEEMIRGRMRSYLPLLQGNGPVLDIGCGRGEFLDVARENKIEAHGIDTDPSMVARARSRGHEVTLEEAETYLRATAVASLGAVFSAQVVEHLHPDSLRALIAETFGALREGGLFVAETVNPHSFAAAKVFWLDITHVRPIFPETLLFLCREVGFRKGEIMFPFGVGDLAHDLRYAGEYAVIATKC